ncbi:WD repeat-containing protein 34, partial [Nowakowskiella sp. JEL0078]
MAAITFSDFVNEFQNINIESIWKQAKPTKENSCQSDPVFKSAQNTQTIESENQHIQTEPEIKIQESAKFNPKTLHDFLNRVESSVSAELMANIRSHAFDGHSVQWEDEVETVQNIHTLTISENEDELLCSDIGWNSTGSVIHVS